MEVSKIFYTTGITCLGLPEYDATVLSPIGEWVGETASECLIAAAGPLQDIGNVWLLTKLTKDSKEAALTICLKALNMAFYALDNHCHIEGHDYCYIRNNAGEIPYRLLSFAAIGTALMVFRKVLGF